jgi:hypothetical protein
MLRNQNSRPRCANPVDDEDCLWKIKEKAEEIRSGCGAGARGREVFVWTHALPDEGGSYQGTLSSVP